LFGVGKEDMTSLTDMHDRGMSQLAKKQKSSINLNARIQPDKYSIALKNIGINQETISLHSHKREETSSETSTSSVLSFSSIASTIDKDKTAFYEKIGNIIGNGLDHDSYPFASEYTDALKIIHDTKNENDEIYRDVEVFISSVDNIIDKFNKSNINSLIQNGVDYVKTISSRLNTNTNNLSYEFLILLRRRVNVKLVQLRHMLLKIEDENAVAKQQDPPIQNDIYDRTLTNTITGLGIIYSGLSYAVSNSLITLYFIKKTLGKATSIAAENINVIINEAEKTIFEVMHGPETESDSTTEYTKTLYDKYKDVGPEIESLIDSVSEYIYRNEMEFEESDFLSNLYRDVRTKHVNFLNKGNDALFLFMEYMRENSNKPVAEQKEISGDVVATMIQLLSLNGEKVALKGSDLEGEYVGEGDGYESDVSALGVKDSYGGRRTRRRGVRRSIKSNKKSKRARGRKTRRAKRKQSTERRRR
jgi:hypothetical protein